MTYSANLSFFATKTNASGAINSGIDGVPIGANTASTGAFTSGTFSTTLGVTGVTTLGNGAILGTPASANLINCTFPTLNQNTTGTAAGLSATLIAGNGGTGQSSYAVGDILYASTTSALSKLVGVATGNVIISGGVTTAPSYGKVGLTTHVSGTLPVANGGTGVTTSTGTGAVVLGTNPTIAIAGSALTLQDATDATKTANFVLSGLTTGTNYTYTLPAVTGVALASLGNISQTFLGATTFEPTTASSTLILGSTAGTGTLTLGRSTVSQTTNIQAGATANLSTKTINIGTGGLAGSNTAITIGSALGTSVITANGVLTLNAPAGGVSPLLITGNTIYSVGAKLENINTTAGSYSIFTVSSGVSEAPQIALVATTNSTQTTAIETVSCDLYIRGAQTWAGIRIGDVYLTTNYNVNSIKLTGSDNSATFYGTLLPATGTTTLSPLTLTTGTLLTTSVAGAVEYSDSEALFFTPNTTTGRSFIVANNYRRLIAAGTAINGTIANFFGANSNISLVASDYYEIEIYMLAARGSSAGTATITLTNSAAPTLMLVDYEQTPLSGVSAPPGSVTALTNLYFRGTTTTNTAAYAVTTGTLAASVNHFFKFKIWLRNSTGTSLKIQMTAGGGNNSMTPQAGSYYTVRTLPNAQTGTFAA